MEKKRALRWVTLQLGLQHTVAAYNVYVASVLSFLVQLEPRPTNWLVYETQVSERP